MSRLLIAGFRRYTKNISFWLAIAVSIGVGIWGGYHSSSCYDFDDVYFIVALFTYAVIVSLIIGREYSDGIFRNKIAVGYSKGQIFISETILAVCVSMGMFIISTAIFIAFNYTWFQFIPFGKLALIYLGVLLITLAFVSIFVLVSCTISNKAIASIINILLVLLIIFAAAEVNKLLRQPQYYDYYEYNDKTGEEIIIENAELNENYIDGSLRTALETVEYILPYGKFAEYETIFSKCLVHLIEREEYQEYDYFTNGKFRFEKEELQLINTVPFYQIGLIIVLLGSGYIIFKKKDFK